MSAGSRYRVLFDAAWWMSGPPSGRHVVRSVVTTWAGAFPDDELTLVVDRRERDAIELDLGRRGITATLRLIPRYARLQAIAAWAAGRTPGDYDVIVTQNFATRAPNALSCVLVHDALYVEHPDWFSTQELIYLRPLRSTLRHADVIFATSRSERQRIERVWPETADRLLAVGLHVPVDLASSTPRRPDSVDPAQRYLLAVGRLNIRKNLQRLIDAFLSEEGLAGYRLLIVGESDGKSEAFDATSQSAERVIFLPNIDDDGLAWLYRNTALFVFPSLAEGFGLPLIEARAAGARVVASDIPVFRELDVAESYFDPSSVPDIGRALRTVLDQTITPTPELSTDWVETVELMRTAVAERLEGTADVSVA